MDGFSVGGLDVKIQESVLRKNPGIVIATPGRWIDDHLANAPTFDTNAATIEVMVLTLMALQPRIYMAIPLHFSFSSPGCTVSKDLAGCSPLAEAVSYGDHQTFIKKVPPVTRVSVLVPTRELGVQVYQSKRNLKMVKIGNKDNQQAELFEVSDKDMFLDYSTRYRKSNHI
ncbi:hypothetical protein TKK_0015433 [Trichogramma kaykai]